MTVKEITRPILVLILFALMAGCTSRQLKGVSENPEENAILCIEDSIRSNEIDGKYYVWSPFDYKMVIPAGKHEFLLRYHSGVRESTAEIRSTVDAKPGEVIYLCNTGGWQYFDPLFTRDHNKCGKVAGYRPISDVEYDWMSDSRKAELQPCLSTDILDKTYYKLK